MIKSLSLILLLFVQVTDKMPAINIEKKDVAYGEAITLRVDNRNGVNGFYYINLEALSSRSSKHWIEVDPDISNEDFDKIFFAKPLPAKRSILIKYNTNSFDKVYLQNHKIYRFALMYSLNNKVFKLIPSKPFSIRR